MKRKLKHYLPHDKLSNKLWNGYKLKKDITTKLMKIADAFVDSLPYEQEDMMSDLRHTLNSAKG